MRVDLPPTRTLVLAGVIVLLVLAAAAGGWYWYDGQQRRVAAVYAEAEKAAKEGLERLGIKA